MFFYSFFTKLASFLASPLCWVGNFLYVCKVQTYVDMTINFNLTSPAAAKSPVRLVISHRGAVIRRSVGLTVRTARWSVRRQLSGDLSADRRIREIRSALEERLDPLSTLAEVRAAVDEVLGPARGGSPAGGGMWAWLSGWAERPCACRRFRVRAVAVARGLMEADGDSWESADRVWAHRLEERLDGAGYSQNYKASVIGRLRTGMKAAYDSGETACQGFRELRPRWRTADTSYLTRDEVDKLWEAGLSGRDADARDLFILGVHTAARFSDYSRLTVDNIRDGLVEFTQAKTAGRVFLPLSPRVSAVLERHGGRAPRMTAQELNRRMKDICRALGFDTLMDITETRGGRTTVRTARKWETVTAHTARRTGATLLYLSGVPLRQCMLITGHTTEANFRKYIRVGGEENARLLADNPLFK